MKVRTRLLLVGLMAMITLVIFSDQSSAEGDATVRGVYGVEGLAKAKDFLKEARVGHIFALPEAAVLGRLKQSGLSVYLTLNVFGGMEAWQKYPDAIPVTATGDLLTGVLSRYFDLGKVQIFLNYCENANGLLLLLRHTTEAALKPKLP